MHYEWSQVIVAGLSGGVGFALFVGAVTVFCEGISAWRRFSRRKPGGREREEEDRARRDYALKMAMRFHRVVGEVPPENFVAAASLFCSFLDGPHLTPVESSAKDLAGKPRNPDPVKFTDASGKTHTYWGK